MHFCFVSSPIVPSDKALCKEASNMKKVSCEFVLRIYGLYQGCHPLGATTTQLGIVMELMERGSLDSLLMALSAPPAVAPGLLLGPSNSSGNELPALKGSCTQRPETK